MTKLLTLTFLFLLVSCHSDNSKEKDILIQEVKSLESLQDKRTFVESIYLDFLTAQKTFEKAYLINPGSEKNTKEETKIYQNKIEKLLEKLEIYLDNYGHPTIMEHGGLASYTPWFVIQNFEDAKIKKRNFKYLFDAYSFGNCPEDLFLKYSEDLFYAENGKPFLPTSLLSQKEKIDEILKSLDLIN